MTVGNPYAGPATRTHAPVDASLRALPLDEAGFLADHSSWSPSVAEVLAAQAGIDGLGRTHWLMIDFIRDRYFRLGGPPSMRQLCRRLGFERDEVKRAFGSCRDLWRIAGLPHPGEEALAHMD
jgi:dissimilatory sulfite reductase related protein